MEIWKDIVFEENGVKYDYTGLYQVSSEGRIKSLEKINSRNHSLKEKILRPQKNNRIGYLFVWLCKNGKRKSFYIHRLVLFMFAPESFFDGAEVDHINTDKTDNRIKNLRWATSKENSNNPLTRKKYSESHKDKKHSEETKRKMSNTRSRKIIGYSLTSTKVIILQSTRQANKFGFDNGTISKCCNGKLKSHKGFKWYYLDDNKNNKLSAKED